MVRITVVAGWIDPVGWGCPLGSLGTLRAAQVPYLELWRTAIEARPKRPGVRKPPLPVLLVIVAMLLSILASARPAVWGRGGEGAPLEVVLDCGGTMSAPSHGLPRVRVAAALLAEEVAKRAPRVSIRLHVLPGGNEKLTDAAGMTQAISSLPTSALNTSASLNQMVAQALRSSDGSVFVVSDQPIATNDSRVVRIAPDAGSDAIGISELAARETPVPGVMVRLLNESSHTTTALEVISGDQRLRQTVQLAPRGAARDYFFSPRELGETIEAAIMSSDDPTAADRAWLARSARWPAIEPRIPLDPSVERMVGVYARRRPPVPGSPTIELVAKSSDLADNQRGIVIASSLAQAPTNGLALDVSDQPITRGINWGRCR